MSKYADRVGKLLKEAFPTHHIVKEHMVRFQGQKLFYDFYLPELRVLIEMQGEQHYKFNKHFHDTKETFERAQCRDRLKVAWAEENGCSLIRISFKEITALTADELKKRICHV